MGILDKVTKLEKRLQQLAARGDVAPQPVEVRRGLLDDVEEMVQPAGRSRRVFPYRPPDAARPRRRGGAARGHAGGPGRRRRDARAGAGSAAGDRLHGAARPGGAASARQEGGRGVAGGQEVARHGRTRRERPGRGVHRSCRRRGGRRDAAGRAEGHGDEEGVRARRRARPRRPAGRGARPGSPRRPAEPGGVRGQRRPGEPDGVAGPRAHPDITRRECRLFDDRSWYGTRIFRDGETIVLPPGSPRGTRLRVGDEIYFGQAQVRVDRGK